MESLLLLQELFEVLKSTFIRFIVLMSSVIIKCNKNSDQIQKKEERETLSGRITIERSYFGFQNASTLNMITSFVCLKK